MRLFRIGLALWLLACVGVAQAALTFPALTGARRSQSCQRRAAGLV